MASRTIAVDFDGTLHPYTAGWTGSVPDDEPPIVGARTFLAELVGRNYTVVVFSTRADHEAGLAGITAWLDKYDLLKYVIKVTHEKPAAIAYVDDRAVAFRGDFRPCLDAIEELAQSRAHGAAKTEDSK